MEEKNELSDILLEQKSSNKITQIKRLAVITVLLVLLFVLVILIMRLISKPEGEEVTVYPTPTNVNIPVYNNEIITENISAITKGDDVQPNETINETSSAITVIETNIVPVETPPAKTVTPAKTQTVPAKSLQTDTKSTVKSGHYIQVGSFSNPPNKSFLDNIAKKDYQYNLHKTTIKSKQVTIVLIGPYPSESLARDELLEIKTSISKDAFYKKIP
ncbi:MAG: SPOR domain-containing protein [Campylobacteraceae bacterium]|jgi:DedD protein|nr:SPOR domain-containing protein [Campylobacteraceae bacterium]